MIHQSWCNSAQLQGPWRPVIIEHPVVLRHGWQVLMCNPGWVSPVYMCNYTKLGLLYNPVKKQLSVASHDCRREAVNFDFCHSFMCSPYALFTEMGKWIFVLCVSPWWGSVLWRERRLFACRNRSRWKWRSSLKVVRPDGTEKLFSAFLHVTLVISCGDVVSLSGINMEYFQSWVCLRTRWHCAAHGPGTRQVSCSLKRLKFYFKNRTIMTQDMDMQHKKRDRTG